MDIVVWTTLGLALCVASPFDPHYHPASNSPFFEGWYTKVADHSTNVSFAVIIGTFQPPHAEEFQQTWAALVLSTPKHPIRTEQLFLNQSRTRIVPLSTPEPGSPSRFRFESEGFGKYMVEDDTASLRYFFPKLNITVEAALSHRVPWDPSKPNSAGPEGWFGKIFPLPTHYYVETLGSKARYMLNEAGSVLQGDGYAHMETNYGKVFPGAWLWSEALGERNPSVQLLASLCELASSVHVAIIAFRSPDHAWDFRMPTHTVESAFSATSAWWAFHVVDGAREIRGNISAPPHTFSDMLYVPTRDGFRNESGCRESYVAVARVEVVDGGKLLESHELPLATLEFGGKYAKQVPVAGHVS